ncbi:MAG TPA: helix-turn-helix domain-containing protein [Allosphingosinicella sp.]|nr:helix-turn-helix domain-containing protein [Allosphingosinicella sp.]
MVEHRNAEFVEAALAVIRQARARIDIIVNEISADTAASLREVAERLYLERRRRDEHFPPGLFGEPAWDLLLAMFIAHEEGRSLSLAQACSAAKVDPEAGPRLIERMAGEGLVVRTRASDDARRSGIALTESAVLRLCRYLSDLI